MANALYYRLLISVRYDQQNYNWRFSSRDSTAFIVAKFPLGDVGDVLISEISHQGELRN
jgi:hypothetical protein